MMGRPEVYSADYFLKDGEEVELAGMKIRVLHTPGHTAGGACYYLPKEMALFSGDTLFCESVGKDGFPWGKRVHADPVYPGKAYAAARFYQGVSGA